MMNRTRILGFFLMAAIFVVVAGGPAIAEEVAAEALDNPVVTKPAPKVGFFGRLVNGVANIVKAPLDIPFTIVKKTSETGNPISGVVAGTVEGVVNGTVRAVAGTVEVVTSPVPGERYPLYERELGERCVREKPAF